MFSLLWRFNPVLLMQHHLLFNHSSVLMQQGMFMVLYFLWTISGPNRVQPWPQLKVRITHPMKASMLSIRKVLSPLASIRKILGKKKWFSASVLIQEFTPNAQKYFFRCSIPKIFGNFSTLESVNKKCWKFFNGFIFNYQDLYSFFNSGMLHSASNFVLLSLKNTKIQINYINHCYKQTTLI